MFRIHTFVMKVLMKCIYTTIKQFFEIIVKCHDVFKFTISKSEHYNLKYMYKYYKKYVNKIL